jgi:dolichol-phosphate mannosyltransferase
MFNEKVKHVFNKSVESNSNYILQLLSLGFIYTFIDYEKKNRKKGKSKWKLANKLKLIVDSFISFSYLPIRFVSVIGVLFFLSGIMWTSYIILRKFIVGDLASGWPTLISILLLGFGITNISLGIVAEYLWRTLDVSRNRPIFIIDEIIELT